MAYGMIIQICGATELTVEDSKAPTLMKRFVCWKGIGLTLISTT